MSDINDALKRLSSFASTRELTGRIAALEDELSSKVVEDAKLVIEAEGVDSGLLHAALDVKRMSGQINVIVHAVGILVSLPFLLEPAERIESLSLGAGNTGRLHDLETSHRVAEFKFIEWKGGAESIRQNGVFVDLFNLASTETDRRKYLYVVGKEHPMRFLNGRRAISSVLSKHANAADRFRAAHGDSFAVVSDYWHAIRDEVEVVDLKDLVPAFGAVSGIGD